MSLSKTLGVILFFIVIIVVTTVAPQVESANSDAITALDCSSECASMIGLGTIMPWGGFLIILAILASTGIFTLRVKEQGFNVQMVISPLVRVIAAIFAVTFFASIIDSFNTLITGTSNDAVKIVWGLILLFIYLAIIGISGGWDTYQYVRERVSKKKASKTGAGYSGGGLP